jgi:cytochrome b
MAAGGHRVRIWDLPTRVFHWALVVLVVTSFVTGKIGGNAMTWHMYSGYAILSLILFRIVWGFVGGRASRFASFVTGPGSVIGYARTLFTREVAHHAGHNPLGGWSVVLMILSLATQAVTGLFASDDIATEGPLAAKASSATVALLTRIHHINETVLVVLVATHVAAILFYAFYKRQNLVHAMITGHQQLPEPAPHTPNRTLLAACLLGIAGAFVYWLVRP